MLVLGIDDVTRSPVIGDLIVAGVLIEEDQLKDLDVRDSKEMTRKQRELIFPEIYKRARGVYVEFITPEEIAQNNLNDLEARAVLNVFKKAVRDLAYVPNKIYVDNWEHNRDKFAWRFLKQINESKAIYEDIVKNNFVIEHNADKKYKVVSSASIIAKVLSDWQYDYYRKKFGDFGSGNPNDKKTLAFLSQHLHNKPRCEACKIIRKSWITYRRLLNKEVGK